MQIYNQTRGNNESLLPLIVYNIGYGTWNQEHDLTFDVITNALRDCISKESKQFSASFMLRTAWGSDKNPAQTVLNYLFVTNHTF